MQDRSGALEAAIAAETLVETRLDRAGQRLHELNLRLFGLRDRIRAAQPVSSGSVCLELYPCGPGCSGCPHPRWVRYHWRVLPDGVTSVLITSNLDAQKREPILALPRAAPHYAATAALIRESKPILAMRRDLLTAMRTLHAAASRKL